MPQPGQPAASKICLVCKQDCSTRPRSKDSQGRYTCKSCSDQILAHRAKAKPAPVAPKPDPVALTDEPNEDWMWENQTMGEELTSPATPSAMSVCPGCRASMPADSIACPACGHNILTGQKTPKHKEFGDGAGRGSGKFSGVASKGFSILIGKNPLVWALAGIVAGAIGAGIWAGIAVATGLEVGYVAWGVGVLVGIGVGFTARENAGLMSGAIAVIVALASIAAGKFVAVSVIVDRLIPQSALHSTPEKDIDRSLASIADQIASEREARGDKLYWPAGMTLQEAGPLSDYPGDVQAAARKQWEGASPQWKQEYIETHRVTADAIKAGVFASTFGLIDLLWAFLAIGSAWGIGSGAGTDLGGDD